VWLVDTAVLARVGLSPTQIINRFQKTALDHLLSTTTLTKLANHEAMYPTEAYRLIDYLNDIDQSMWSELESNRPIDRYRRSLQTAYVQTMIKLSGESGAEYRDVAPLVRAKLVEIKSKVKKGIQKSKDDVTKYHLQYIY